MRTLTKEKIPLELAYNFSDLVHYHDRKHDRTREGAGSSTSWSTGSRRYCVSHWEWFEPRRPQSPCCDTRSPTRPYLLTVTLRTDQAFERLSLWGACLFRPPQRATEKMSVFCVLAVSSSSSLCPDRLSFLLLST